MGNFNGNITLIPKPNDLKIYSYIGNRTTTPFLILKINIYMN